MILAFRLYNKLIPGAAVFIDNQYAGDILTYSTKETLEISMPTLGRGSFCIHKQRFRFTEEGIILET